MCDRGELAGVLRHWNARPPRGHLEQLVVALGELVHEPLVPEEAAGVAGGVAVEADEADIPDASPDDVCGGAQAVAVAEPFTADEQVSATFAHSWLPSPSRKARSSRTSRAFRGPSNSVAYSSSMSRSIARRTYSALPSLACSI